MESPERSVAMEIPANDGVFPCSTPTVPTWLKKRLSEPKTPLPCTVEEIETKLRDADLRRQKFYEHLSKKARPKPRSPPRSSSNEDDPAQRLEAKLQAAEEKRLSILASAQMRLAKLHELRLAAKKKTELCLKQKRAELGSRMEMRVRQAEANRLHILRAHRQRRAALKERTSQSLLRRMARESKYKERVRAAIHQKRANAENKRLGLLEEEKRRARARFLKVQKAATSASHEREIQRSEMKIRLEDRLQKARRKRAEYLKQRRGLNNFSHDSWDILHEQGEMLSRKLSRCWTKFKKVKKTTAYLAKAYNDLNIKEMSVKSMPFEQIALLIQSISTLHTTKALLDRIEIRYKLSRTIGHLDVPSGSDDIDHLLKRVASPKKRVSPRKSVPNGGDNKSTSSMQGAKTSLLLSRYQVRVVLCAYMILGHPDAVISGQGERETALVKSAEKFVKEFDLLIKALLDGPLQTPSEGSCKTFRSQLAAFDSAWCSFLNSFVVWKAKDAKSLEEDLVRAACRLELSMFQTCKMTSEDDIGALSHDMKAIKKQVLEDQKLLREKVSHLSGDAGIERMEIALSDARSKFFKARENGTPISPLTSLMLSPSPASSSSLGTSGKASKPLGSKKESSVVRCLFKDELSREANSSTSTSNIPQSSRETLDMENVRFVNKYVHGERLCFGDVSSLASQRQNEIMAKIKETMEKAFWDGIIKSVREDEPDYSRIVDLMREVRDGICDMAPLSWRQEITETIDLEILTEVLNFGNLDIDYLGKTLEYTLFTLLKLSAPAYEEELKKKHQKFIKDLAETACGGSQKSQVIALIEGLRFVLEQIQELKQEVSKARIRLLEPFLKGPDALNFLGKAFVGCYGHPSDAGNALPLTAQWLSSARVDKLEEWNEHKRLIEELMIRSNSSSMFLPSTTLRTGGGSLGKLSGNLADPSIISTAASYIETDDPQSESKGEDIDLLVRLGLLKFVRKIAGLTEGELPETMKLNLFRLRGVQSELQKIIVVATSLLVLRQTLLSQQIVSSQVQLNSILSNSFKHLSECLNTVEDAGVKEIISSLVSSIEEDNNEPHDNLNNLESIKEIMARMLNKSLQEEDAVFTRVSRAVYLALRGVVLGGTGKHGRDLAEMGLQKVGAALLIDDIMQVGAVLVVMAKVSVIVHGPWYANLIKE